MLQEERFLLPHWAELMDRAVQRGIYTRTGFLSLGEQSLLLSLLQGRQEVPYTAFGGMEGCERRVFQFGDESLCGYEQPLPIRCLRIEPRGQKFSDPLAHRDCLGALMALGVERETLGDLFPEETGVYLFCLDTVAPYLTDSLTSVGRTPVQVFETEPPSAGALLRLRPGLVKLASLRLDSLISGAYNLSREEGQRLIAGQKVFLNGLPAAKASMEPKAGDLISVRGYGRFRLEGDQGLTKKGKHNISISYYGDGGKK